MQNTPNPAGTPPCVFVFSGLDPSGGAGFIADVQVVNRHGCYPMGAITLETVQDTLGVQSLVPNQPEAVYEQALTACRDIHPAAVKIGALGSLAMVNAMTRLLREPEFRGLPIVLDTVLFSSNGTPLLAPAAMDRFQEDLFPLVSVITPNLEEFGLLSGHRALPDSRSGEIDTWLAEFAGPLPCAVLLKGGHLAGAPEDRLWQRGVLTHYPGNRIDTLNSHGTGCVLSSALACRLALGHHLSEAVLFAKEFIGQALAGAPGLGKGSGPLDLGQDARLLPE